ncbi:phosphotransferase [Frankia sp. AiPs1]|uniref:phosphotransferase n=1 Tax=Frankia sp. AiPs1 TaxID=573493 RepID=UPI002042E0A0|nr:phosphotransferase [Frankia sp. AiPs1]MCM3924697.1 phosphotransferase [Frankia sp. AiPs1]
MTRIVWAELPSTVRREVEERAGRVTASHPADGGRSDLTATLETDRGLVFIKAAQGRPFAPSLRNEAATNPYVRDIAPALLWHVEADGWTVLGFEHVAGRQADFTPGSPDLPLFRAALDRLQCIPLPPHATARVEQHYGQEPAMTGEALLHTDLNRHNVLITGQRAMIVDWAWACRGAPWVDLALVAFLFMVAGHSVEEAEAWGATFPTWVDDGALTAFVTANERVWHQAAGMDAPGWKLRAARIAERWAEQRQATL